MNVFTRTETMATWEDTLPRWPARETASLGVNKVISLVLAYDFYIQITNEFWDKGKVMWGKCVYS